VPITTTLAMLAFVTATGRLTLLFRVRARLLLATFAAIALGAWHCLVLITLIGRHLMLRHYMLLWKRP
jgi:hypothetical protein